MDFIRILTQLSINDYPVYTFFWNLFLLIIPFFLVKILIGHQQAIGIKKVYQKIFTYTIVLIWLVFIPNTAYIITDIRHINNICFLNSDKICVTNTWMIIVFFTYALIGWVSFVYLLNQMKYFLKIYTKKDVKIFIWLIIPFISIGVMLGLLERWNSWEVITHPLLIVYDIRKYFYIKIYFINWIIFTFFLYLLYFCGDYLFKKLKFE
jgi:uncharacterized membrane protein